MSTSSKLLNIHPIVFQIFCGASQNYVISDISSGRGHLYQLATPLFCSNMEIEFKHRNEPR